jgi:hypothetical protein
MSFSRISREARKEKEVRVASGKHMVEVDGYVYLGQQMVNSHI